MSKPIKHRGKWRIRWLDADGRRQSEVYTDKADALFKLREHQQEVDEIERGLRIPIVGHKTVGDLCDYWKAHRAVKKRSGKNDESIIECHLRPALGHLRIRGDLSVEHDDRFTVEQIAAKHLDPKTVHNHLTLLISL